MLQIKGEYYTHNLGGHEFNCITKKKKKKKKKNPSESSLMSGMQIMYTNIISYMCHCYT